MKYSIIIKKIFNHSDLVIDYHPDLEFTIPSENLSDANAIWQARKDFASKNNIRFYNGELFSLLDMAIDGDKVNLKLGRCRYKDYVATRTRLIRNNKLTPVFADPLAICSLVITADDRILIGKRTGVDGSLNKLHVVGGFVERNKDDANHIPSPFQAISREIYEEVGLEISLNKITCLGIVYVETLPHPEMCFYALTNLTYDDIIKLEPEDMEVEHWRYIENNPDSLANFILANYDDIASPGLAGLLLYGEMRFGEKWVANLRLNRPTKPPALT